MADVSAETEKTRAEVAEYLHEFADELSPVPWLREPTGSTEHIDLAYQRPT